MARFAAFVSLLAAGIVFQLSHGVEVNVTDKEGKLCLYANLMVNFSVSYPAGEKIDTVEFELPSEVTTNGSECGATSSTLKLNFGDGRSWSVNFTMDGNVYQADYITFSYNLSDTTVFPSSGSNETASVTVKSQITNVGVDTCYSCNSKDMILTDMVNMTLSSVLIQAFVSEGNKSENITSCSADQPVTSPPPTTQGTNATTPAPVTNATSTAPPPTTTPTPTLPPPNTGKYSVNSDNTTVCLLADFGLRISIKQGETYQEMNLEPNKTTASGSCGVNSSELQLVSSTMTIMLTFINDTAKFRLHAVNFTAKTGSGVDFNAVNTNLTLWEAAIGSSYMCNKEQNYTITNLLSFYTFNLRVQPFGIAKGVFNTAEECKTDVDSFLVPIAVGVALLVLIVIVLLAYFIGRKRNMSTGYESF
ncbi:lysosome-associated membrane glycoprotein 2 isoform X2 [Hippoglossus hippoglossus]|uniref:lysosome-associated membrane glycoprotein 2 isoform X2 n=1 Tax=Hippoglossus hippoglossus TaxID=8267 RepID=UPI00148E1F42|nr:lysosome-associated membrane glycoprotein 2 isoform X2 [Hippoglossus hippoglossus]XP_035017972.1 lysosome-associated membrane glycoprotein 2 isoform X1 [Hippoglossus stenolepis]